VLPVSVMRRQAPKGGRPQHGGIAPAAIRSSNAPQIPHDPVLIPVSGPIGAATRTQDSRDPFALPGRTGGNGRILYTLKHSGSHLLDVIDLKW